MKAVAAEIEDSFSFNFQADSVHSGSISFGRFADETLSWERRSSFSHNKILEEVERCSKHGLVTEKKAYFEAQFKRKALLRQGSSEDQNGTAYGTCERENADHSHREEKKLDGENKNDAHPDILARTGYREDYACAQEAQIDIHYDGSLNSSDDFEEMGMIEYQVDGREILISEPLKYHPSYDSDYLKVKVDNTIVLPEDTQTVIDCTFSRLNSVEPDPGVQQITVDDACNAEGECRAITISSIDQETEKGLDATLDHLNPSPKSTAAAGPSTLVPPIKASQTHRRSLTEAAKKSLSNLIRRDSQRASETKTYKHSVRCSSSTAKRMPDSPKPEKLLSRPTSYTSKFISSNRSVCQESKGTRAVQPQVSASKKVTPSVHQTPKRPKKIATPHGSDLKTPASFSFRSRVQPEKREETEINRSQSRTQEKAKAETGQFRRSLSFNAKSMPSFYNDAEQAVPKSKGAILSNMDTNPSNLRNQVAGRSSINQNVVRASLESQLKGSKTPIYTEKRPTKASGVSSAGKKSSQPCTLKIVASTRKAPVSNQDVSLKKLIVTPNAEMTKGKGTVRTHNSRTDRTTKFSTSNAPEKVSLDKSYRPTARIHS